MPTNPYQPPQEETATGNSLRLSPLFWIVATLLALVVAFPALAAIVMALSFQFAVIIN